MSLNNTRTSQLRSLTEDSYITPFHETLSKHNLELKRDKTTILQVNIGLKCNQTCTHCHLSAGPGREEIMSLQTMDQIAEFAGKNSFEIIDITGGAPELHPNLPYFVEAISSYGAQIILRSNLSALYQKRKQLMPSLKTHRVNIVASFPSLNVLQTESIRGKGVFDTSIDTLKMINSFGYGNPESGLLIDLVVNPAGAFLSPSQDSLEKRYKKTLDSKYGIQFNQLYSFANVPLGRFKQWLLSTGNYDTYMNKLVSAFNPTAIEGVMCKKILSLSWDGYLYDCDFNQADNLYQGTQKKHISDIGKPPEPGTAIAIGDHCYTCTAGAGFT